MKNKKNTQKYNKFNYNNDIQLRFSRNGNKYQIEKKWTKNLCKQKRNINAEDEVERCLCDLHGIWQLKHTMKSFKWHNSIDPETGSEIDPSVQTHDRFRRKISLRHWIQFTLETINMLITLPIKWNWISEFFLFFNYSLFLLILNLFCKS